MERSKQSRRSACDRCRTYKLRCERVSSEGNNCGRCIKLGIFCATTNTAHRGSKTKKSQSRAVHSSLREPPTMSAPNLTTVPYAIEPDQLITPTVVSTQSNAFLGCNPSPISTSGDYVSSSLALLLVYIILSTKYISILAI
jgi:hypothetical protein